MSYPFTRRTLGLILKPRIASAEGLENIPPTGPVLLVANHVGYHDPLLLGAAVVMYTQGRKVHCIAKWKVFHTWFFTTWLGTIPLFQDRAKTVAWAKRLLQQGEVVLIYPEGGINNASTISKVMSGAARVAHSTGAVVIPVGIRRASPYPTTEFGRFLELLYARIHISIGKPVDLSRRQRGMFGHGEIWQYMDTIMPRVAELAGKTYSPSHG